jgi:hypothetical protein
VSVLAPEERLPAVMPSMKVTAATAASRSKHQLTGWADNHAYKIFLIVPASAAQTRPLRTTFIACHRDADYQPLVIPSAASGVVVVSPGDEGSAGGNSTVCSPALIFSSSAFKRFSATYSLADLCSDSAFSLLIPSTSRISSSSLSETSSADLNPA